MCHDNTITGEAIRSLDVKEFVFESYPGSFVTSLYSAIRHHWWITPQTLAVSAEGSVAGNAGLCLSVFSVKRL